MRREFFPRGSRNEGNEGEVGGNGESRGREGHEMKAGKRLIKNRRRESTKVSSKLEKSPGGATQEIPPAFEVEMHGDPLRGIGPSWREQGAQMPG